MTPARRTHSLTPRQWLWPRKCSPSTGGYDDDAQVLRMHNLRNLRKLYRRKSMSDRVLRCRSTQHILPGDVSSASPTSRSEEDDNKDDDNEDVVCHVCSVGSFTRDNNILLCDGLCCRRGVHQLCHSPILRSVPDGPWYCQWVCAPYQWNVQK